MKKLILVTVLISSFLFANSVAPVDNKLYDKECGTCHLAFQPGLLPQRSWAKLMADLGHHFDTDASLAQTDRTTLLEYVTKNSSENSNSRLSQIMSKYINANETPIRITETMPFMRWHDEISSRVFARASIASPSNCAACHTGAAKGDYSEDYVRIPH